MRGRARVIPIDPATNRQYHYWHVFVPGMRPGSSTATGRSGRSIRRTASGSTRRRSCSIRTAAASSCRTGYTRERSRASGDNAATAMKSVVVDPSRLRLGRRPCRLHTPSSRTVVYEMHVRGFTRHPSSGVSEARAAPTPD